MRGDGERCKNNQQHRLQKTKIANAVLSTNNELEQCTYRNSAAVDDDCNNRLAGGLKTDVP